MADETHHRDVNHTFADMKSDEANPFIVNHKGEFQNTDESAHSEITINSNFAPF
jgi:hypothetical protein